MFDGVNGGRLTNHNARRGVDWETLREAIGRPDLRIHDLRHTFATILFDAGAALNDALRSEAGEPSQRTRRRTPADLNGTLIPGGITR
ncbi:MAG TPA: hypothetical protein VNT53_05995 [Pseudolysinimonas sp.]|nr:hypothetical protein [Pseudolysinimonas sp.]